MSRARFEPFSGDGALHRAELKHQDLADIEAHALEIRPDDVLSFPHRAG